MWEIFPPQTKIQNRIWWWLDARWLKGWKAVLSKSTEYLRTHGLKFKASNAGKLEPKSLWVWIPKCKWKKNNMARLFPQNPQFCSRFSSRKIMASEECQERLNMAKAWSGISRIFVDPTSKICFLQATTWKSWHKNFAEIEKENCSWTTPEARYENRLFVNLWRGFSTPGVRGRWLTWCPPSSALSFRGDLKFLKFRFAAKIVGSLPHGSKHQEDNGGEENPDFSVASIRSLIEC